MSAKRAGEIEWQDYGTLIMPPFRLTADNLKPEDNVLAVEVTVVSANRIRDLDRAGRVLEKLP